MSLIIKHQQVVADTWQQIPTEATLDSLQPQDSVIVPLSLWREHAQSLKARSALGIWLDSDEPIEDIVEDLQCFSVIALNFPVFTDGRHFSSARLLRERYGYTGEIRAVGDVFRDQLFYLQRCGFDAFVIRADRDPHDALLGLTEFSVSYQAAVNEAPLYRRLRA